MKILIAIKNDDSTLLLEKITSSLKRAALIVYSLAALPADFISCSKTSDISTKIESYVEKCSILSEKIETKEIEDIAESSLAEYLAVIDSRRKTVLVKRYAKGEYSETNLKHALNRALDEICSSKLHEMANHKQKLLFSPQNYVEALLESLKSAIEALTLKYAAEHRSDAELQKLVQHSDSDSALVSAAMCSQKIMREVLKVRPDLVLLQNAKKRSNFKL